MERIKITVYIMVATSMLFLFGCNTFKYRTPYYIPYRIISPEDEADNFRFIYLGDTIKRAYILEGENYTSGYFMWRSDLIDIHKSNIIDSATSIHVNEFSPLSDVRKQFRIESKAMYENQTKIDDFLVRFAESEDNFATLRFSFQLKEIEYYHSKYKFESWKTIQFVENNLYAIDFYYPKMTRIYFDKLEFTNGTGTWRDYYFVTFPVDTFILKEEGEINDNYKIGKWKYYDSEGDLIYTREYKKRDKVDVRFPYCIWNKVEPCYCNN